MEAPLTGEAPPQDKNGTGGMSLSEGLPSRKFISQCLAGQFIGDDSGISEAMNFTPSDAIPRTRVEAG